MINNPIVYKFFKDFTNHRKKTKRVVVFSCDLSSTNLNTGTTNKTFQKSRKSRLFQTHIEDFS